jgi:hypothetical protein
MPKNQVSDSFENRGKMIDGFDSRISREESLDFWFRPQAGLLLLTITALCKYLTIIVLNSPP